jgi:hypothetical protein
MRKIERDMLEALTWGRDMHKANTSVQHNPEDGSAVVRLHGNCIARFDYLHRHVSLYDGGWTSNTTKSRLNALASAYGVQGVYQKNWEWFNDDGTAFVSGASQRTNR